MNKKIIIFAAMVMLQSSLLILSAVAQPQARRQQQAAKQQAKNNTMSVRAQISFPTTAAMSEDVVWRRDIYRELDLTQKENAGLYYPEEPVGDKMNLFTYIFKLMLSGQIKVYEYRLDGNESFSDSARVKPKNFLDDYGIYYENGRVDNSDIPSRFVTSYYLKESAYYDQANATFHKKVLALCPIMKREGDFGDDTTPFPLFWVKYDDLAPFLAKHTIMTSDLNNAATMSADDYFAKNQYKGKIYKTTNMLGRTLAQYCPDEASLSAEQKRIEAEIELFEKSIYGQEKKADEADNDSITADSKDVKKAAKTASKAAKTTKTATVKSSTPRTKSSSTKTKTKSSSSSSSGNARVTVRRQRR